MGSLAVSYTLQDMFAVFSQHEDSKSDGKTITLSQSDKWMKHAAVIGKRITTTDTGICFNKFKSRKITYSDYEKFLSDLAKLKSLDVNDIINKMVTCGLPGTTAQNLQPSQR